MDKHPEITIDEGVTLQMKHTGGEKLHSLCLSYDQRRLGLQPQDFGAGLLLSSDGIQHLRDITTNQGILPEEDFSALLRGPLVLSTVSVRNISKAERLRRRVAQTGWLN